MELLFGRHEGRALKSTLDQAGILSYYHLAVDKRTIQGAFKVLTGLLSRPRKANEVLVPYLYLSAHESDHGLSLTSGEAVSWTELGGYIMRSQPTGGAGARWSVLMLCLPICEGVGARELFEGESPPCPWQAILAPTVQVKRNDAVVAFSAFYHLAVLRQQSWPASVRAMNAAAGLDGVFEVHTAPVS